MPKFIIEREIPHAESFDIQQLKTLSKKSRAVLDTLGTDIQWIHSYVAGDKIYCIYMATNKEILFEHARIAGFPANHISEVANIIDPQWGEWPVFITGIITFYKFSMYDFLNSV